VPLLTANVIFLSLISISSFVVHSLSQGLFFTTFLSHFLNLYFFLFFQSSFSRFFVKSWYITQSLISISSCFPAFILKVCCLHTISHFLCSLHDILHLEFPGPLVYMTLCLPNLHFVMFATLHSQGFFFTADTQSLINISFSFPNCPFEGLLHKILVPHHPSTFHCHVYSCIHLTKHRHLLTT
jgi:hypothetical protein